MWGHFRVSAPEEIHTENDEVDDETSSDNLIDISFERVQENQERNERNNGEISEDNDSAASHEVKVWYHNIKSLVDHFRAVSFSLIFILGTILSFDDMMVRFMGRSLSDTSNKK